MAGVNQNGVAEFPAVQTHGGQFVQYNVFGNLFEVTAKYRPPIMPIGRGAYGIVWYCFVIFFFSLSLFIFIFGFGSVFFLNRFFN